MIESYDIENPRKKVSFMSFLSKIFLNWHTLQRNYHRTLLEGCLCSKMKNKLHQKIHYHQGKIHRIKSMEAPF